MAQQSFIKRLAPKRMTLDDFAVKLLGKIIEAPDARAIERYIAVAVKALDNKKVNGYIIQRFIDRVTRYLNDHVSVNGQQAANAELARKKLQAFREAIAQPSS